MLKIAVYCISVLRIGPFLVNMFDCGTKKHDELIQNYSVNEVQVPNEIFDGERGREFSYKGIDLFLLKIFITHFDT